MAHSFLEEKSQALKYFKTHYKREPHNIRELARFSLEQLPKAIDKENEQRMQVWSYVLMIYVDLYCLEVQLFLYIVVCVC